MLSFNLSVCKKRNKSYTNKKFMLFQETPIFSLLFNFSESKVKKAMYAIHGFK